MQQQSFFVKNVENQVSFYFHLAIMKYFFVDL